MLPIEPPRVGSPFGVLVPQSDADGNDMGGVRLPELQVPLATYTGWNLRDSSIGAPDQRVSFLGSFIPSPRLLKTANNPSTRGLPSRSATLHASNTLASLQTPPRNWCSNGSF